MGKKDKSKNKKKISGIEKKTALKIEKKLNARQEKEIAVLGEVRGFNLFYFVFFESTKARKNESVNTI